jgi:hypothetical protein
VNGILRSGAHDGAHDLARLIGERRRGVSRAGPGGGGAEMFLGVPNDVDLAVLAQQGWKVLFGWAAERTGDGLIRRTNDAVPRLPNPGVCAKNRLFDSAKSHCRLSP